MHVFSIYMRHHLTQQLVKNHTSYSIYNHDRLYMHASLLPLVQCNCDCMCSHVFPATPDADFDYDGNAIELHTSDADHNG